MASKAMAHLDLALRMSPHDPQNVRIYMALAAAHYAPGRDTAAKAVQQCQDFLFEEVPCVAGFIDDVVVVVEDGDGEFVSAQIFPDVFDRVELLERRVAGAQG